MQRDTFNFYVGMGTRHVLADVSEVKLQIFKVSMDAE